MIKDLLLSGYGQDMDLSCSEKIVYAANQSYSLGLDKKALKMAAGFGGGMAIEGTCGAITGSIMVLGIMFVDKSAHESTRIKELTKELIEKFQIAMGYIDCGPLKEHYRTEEFKCRDIILKAAEILDGIITRELNK